MLEMLRNVLYILQRNKASRSKLEAMYRKYKDNVEQAQIDQALRLERITNLSIVQPATYEIAPTRPRVGYTLLESR